jgi:hypothetical protein
MKKSFSKIVALAFLVVLSSCGDSDNSIDKMLDETSSGGFLRTIELNGVVIQTGIPFNSAGISLGSDNSPFTLVLEAQDNKNGADMDRVDVYLQYLNNNDGPVASTDEIFWKSYQPSDFSIGPIGLPRLNFASTLGEIRQGLNINDDQYGGGDQFIVVFKYVMKDGRIFSWDNSNSNVVGGVYIRSPFKYTLNVECPITESLAGTHSYNSYNLRRGPAGTSACGPTSGTVVWSSTVPGSTEELAEGTYYTSDFSFGMYAVCWGDPPATSNSARVKWFCRSIITEGVDFYSDSFTYTMVNVSGAVMTIDWINGYGDRGRVEITREGGLDWPEIFQN